MHFTEQKAEALLRERFGKDTILALATEADGVPSVRLIDAYYEDGAFYAITHALSGKMRQIAQNPRVAVAGEWFTAHGTASNLGWFGLAENREVAGKLRRVFAAWIDNGHNDFSDRNTVIVRVELTDALLFSNGTRYELTK